MKNAASLLLGLLLRLERGVLAVGYFGITVLLLLDVLGREFTGKGLFGANIYATNILIYTAMAGFGLATATGGHLRPRMADRLVPVALLPLAIRAGQLASAAILVVIAAAAVQFVVSTWDFAETNQVTGLPLWPIQAALPIGFGFSALRHCIYAAWPDLAPQEKDGPE